MGLGVRLADVFLLDICSHRLHLLGEDDAATNLAEGNEIRVTLIVVFDFLAAGIAPLAANFFSNSLLRLAGWHWLAAVHARQLRSRISWHLTDVR